MGKLKNITPEERENALALIRKMGLEETEQQINYYVRMQRDSKEHREERELAPKKGSNGSMGKIFLWGIVIVIFLMMKMCGGCNGCGGNDDSSDSYNSFGAPTWIQGKWTCVTPIGTLRMEIDGNHIRETFSDGESFYGTYRIDGDYIIPESGSHTHILMDKSTKRLSAGQGYYFEKQ